jgi:hypothetical protein
MAYSERDPKEELGQELEEIYGSPLPKCCGHITFLGNESPDGKWIKQYKAWFKCMGCNRVFSEKRAERFDSMFSSMR